MFLDYKQLIFGIQKRDKYFYLSLKYYMHCNIQYLTVHCTTYNVVFY
nr:MAG TPA: hypothetical protein [Caudoviricetes sp.]